MSKAVNIPFKLPPLSDPRFVERFRQTKDQNFITHFYECFKRLHIAERNVHNNAKDMLKIIIQQRRELLDKLSHTNEALAEMEEKLKNLNKENEIKQAKLEEEQSKYGTIMFHLNGLNQKYDQMEKEKADLINKLSISEQTVSKWVSSAMEDHDEAGKYKAENEELQKQLNDEKENSKKLTDKADAAQKEIETLNEQKKILDQQIESLKKQQQQQKSVPKEAPKNAKRPRQNFQVGFASPTTSSANQRQQQIHQPSVTSPPDLPSFTPPENSASRPQESVQQLQNYVVFQQSHFETPSNQVNREMPSNGQQSSINTPLLVQKLQSSNNATVSPQQQHQQILVHQVPDELMAANNNNQQQQQLTLPIYYLLTPPQNIHPQQLQQQQQQSMQFVQSQQQQHNMHVSPSQPRKVHSRPQSNRSSSSQMTPKQIPQQQQQCHQISTPSFAMPQNTQIPPQASTHASQLSSRQLQIQNGHSNIATGPQNMQIPSQAQIQASQMTSHQQAQIRHQHNSHLNTHQNTQIPIHAPTSASQINSYQNHAQTVHPNNNSSIATVPQTFQLPTNDMMFQFNNYFNTLSHEEKNRIFREAGLPTVTNPVIEISH